ncbi:MAG: hypothetical protein ACRBBR_14790 [Cellvibrionaceae bacterium]
MSDKQQRIIKVIEILQALAEEGLIKSIKVQCENIDGSVFEVEEK